MLMHEQSEHLDETKHFPRTGMIVDLSIQRPLTTGQTCTDRPVSMPQNSQMAVNNNRPPTFQPTSLATASQSHLLSHVNASQAFISCREVCLFLGDLTLGRRVDLGVTSPRSRPWSSYMTLDVTHIWIVRLHPVVTPMTVQARSGRDAPKNHKVM